MDKKTLDRIRTERLERVDSNLEYLTKGESEKRVDLLKRDARMMKEGIDDLYYALLDILEGRG